MKKFDKKLRKATKVFLEMAYGADPNAQNITKEEMVEMIRGITDQDKSIKFTSVVKAAARKKIERRVRRLSSSTKLLR